MNNTYNRLLDLVVNDGITDESSGGTKSTQRRAKFRTPKQTRARLQYRGPTRLDYMKSKDLPVKDRLERGAYGVVYDRDQIQGRQEGDTDDARSDRRITDRGRAAAGQATSGPIKPGSLRGDSNKKDPRDRTNKYNAGRGWGVPGKAGR